MDRTKIILLGALGAAGVIGYVIYRKKKDQEALAFSTAAIPSARPGFIETITGALTTTFSEGLKKASAPSPTLADKIKARGTAHFAAWSSASSKGQAFYVVGNGCFRTSDGATVTASNCPVLQLEGLGSFWYGKKRLR